MNTPRVLVISYNPIDGVPLGRTVVGPVACHTGDYLGYSPFASRASLSLEQVEELMATARKTLDGVVRSQSADIEHAEHVYVYVGASAMKEALTFIESIMPLGKKVTMVACDCGFSAKQECANRFSIPWIMSECGGEVTLGNLVEKLQAN
ncbi:MAG: hypothetical protein KBC02_01100 [Candidatus Pacebacteria bacterium]|nr:hypothetical protein [Candidatus Paceibacterota bacterium]